MNQEYWNKAVAFHGHECPGLAIGVRVCEAAGQVMELSPSFDEELVCVTENDACGVDAIQSLLSCTMGKGNLIYRGTGKHAYTFINRETGKAVRFYLKADKGAMDRQTYFQYLADSPLEEIFSWQEVEMPAPEPARRFLSVACESCGELAPEHKIRLQDGKKVCLDCFTEYNRGW